MKHFNPRRHETHKESLWRFLALILIIGAYFAYMSWKFDAATGAWLAILSWSFFVLCTPVADGGFVVAFPVRLLFGIRMVMTQIAVWFAAVSVNIYALLLIPETYSETVLTKLLHSILTNPWPYWSILLISALGTILSIMFGDEMIDVTKHAKRKIHHKHGFKHRTLLILGLSMVTVFAYYQILSGLGLSIS